MNASDVIAELPITDWTGAISPEQAATAVTALEDGRVVVRPFAPDDIPAVRHSCDDPDVAHWIHLVPQPYSLADAEQFVIESRRRLAAGDRARLAVADAQTGLGRRAIWDQIADFGGRDEIRGFADLPDDHRRDQGQQHGKQGDPRTRR